MINSVFHTLNRTFNNTRFKLSFWNTAFFFVLLLLLITYLVIYFRADQYKDSLDFLLHEAEEVAAFVAEAGTEADRLEKVLLDEVIESQQFKMRYSIIDSSKKVLSGEDTPIFLTAYEKVQTAGVLTEDRSKILKLNENGRKQWAAAAKAVQPDGTPAWVFLLSGMDFIDENLLEYKKKILWIVPVLFVLSMTAGWVLSGIALGPVQGLTRHMEAISVTSLKERVKVKGTGDEIDRLAATFNHLMQRIDDAYGRISQFTSDAAHEIKTPITIIRNEMEVALTRNRTEREYRELLESSLEEMERLSVLVDKMLMLARTDSRAAAKEEVPLRKLLEDVKDFFEPACEPNSITIEVEAPEEIVLLADGDLLRQLFYNLIDNAVRYNRQGGNIKVTLTRDETQALVTVADTGPGVAPEHQEKIFDRFYRVDASRSSVVPGHGLGLAICRAAVKAHGGSLTLRSFPGKGSEFTVFLPLPTALKIN